VSDLHPLPEHPHTASVDHVEELLASRAGESAPLREGLPPEFRMRADAHYVDLLDAPRGRLDIDAVPEVAAATPVVVGTRDDRVCADAAAAAASAAGGTEVARSLSALQTCVTLLADPVSAFARGVGANLARAEIQRARCLLQSVRVIRGELPIGRTPVLVQDLVARVLESIEPERRLRGISIHRQLILSHSRIHVDGDLLVCALSGLVIATLELVDGTDAQLAVLARVDPGGDFTFAVTHNGLTMPSAWLAPGREMASNDRADAIGAVALLAARRIVESCEGRIAVTGSGRGAGFRITLPSLPSTR
jgi:hypothetical protein